MKYTVLSVLSLCLSLFWSVERVTGSKQHFRGASSSSTTSHRQTLSEHPTTPDHSSSDHSTPHGHNDTSATPRSPFIPDNTTIAYYSPAYEVLRQYFQTHGRTALQHDFNHTLCQRRFIPAYMPCDLAGNDMIELADSLLWAIALNRSLVITSYLCTHSVSSRSWAMKHDELIPALRQAKCPPDDATSYTLYVSGKIEGSFGHNYTTLRCCDVTPVSHTLPQNIINTANEHIQFIPYQFIGPAIPPGRTQQKLAWDVMNPLLGKNQILTTKTSQNLMKSFFNFNSLNTMNGKGKTTWKSLSYDDKIRSFIVYGHAMNMMLKFDQRVKDVTKPILSSLYDVKVLEQMMNLGDRVGEDENVHQYQPLFASLPTKAVVFGLHLRHSAALNGNETLEKQQDACQLKCFKHRVKAVITKLQEKEMSSSLKKKDKVHIPCVILLGIDRNHSIDSATNLASDLNCTLQYVPRSRRADLASLDMGAWGTSYFPSSDAYLLSHAHYFMGNQQSAFSMVVASLMAARHDIAKYRYLQQQIFDQHEKHQNKNKKGGHKTSSSKSSKEISKYYDVANEEEEPYLWAMSDTCLYKKKNEKEDEYCSDWLDKPPTASNGCGNSLYTFDVSKGSCV